MYVKKPQIWLSLSLNTVYHNIKKDKRVDFRLPYLNKYNTIAHF